jgi:hypothetical protein
MMDEARSLFVFHTNCQTQLNGFVNTVTYDINGLPTSVYVDFETDFTINQVGKHTGDVYVAWTLSETGTGDLYNAISQDNDIAFDNTDPASASTIIFTLTSSGTSPSVETFDVILDATLKYVNTDDYTIEMFRQQYTITVTVTSIDPVATSAPALSIQAGTTSNSYSPGTTDTAKGVSVASPLPPNFSLAASGGGFAHPDAIVVVASTSDTNYKVWHDTATTIQVRAGSAPTSTLMYEWPNGHALATATQESGSTNSVTFTLASVPTEVYNAGTVYIHLTVKFRDVQAGRRALRGLVEEHLDHVTAMVAPVQLVPRSSKELDDTTA